MSSGAHQQPAPVVDTTPPMDSYLLRLYIESRKVLFRIILGNELPPAASFPADAARTADILRRIQSLVTSDEHLADCRRQLGANFPGRLAVLFNLAGSDDELYPPERLRESTRRHVARHEAGLSGQQLDEDDRRAMEQLKGSSRLQQQLAYLVNYTPGKWLLEQEIPVVLASRERRLGSNAPKPGVSFTPGEDSYVWSGKKGRLSGLCLSGGGIRSATFNLGVLQGLARRNLLRHFDYCSSVSGGGYIHQWLAAWIRREEAQHPGDAGSPGLDAVCRSLIPQPDPGCGPIAAEPIRWLRRYSNYLTPKTGLFSADTWVTVAIWLRNTILNQIVLIAALVSVLLLPHIFLLRALTSSLPTITETPERQSAGMPMAPVALGALILLLLALSYYRVVARVANGLLAARRRDPCERRLTERELGWDVVLPSMVFALVVSVFGFWFSIPGLTRVQQLIALCSASFLGLLVFNIVVTWAAGARETRLKAGRPCGLAHKAAFVTVAVLGALVGTGGVVLARNTFVTRSPIRFGLHARMAPAAGQPAAPPAKPAAAAAPRHLPPEPDRRWRAVLVFGPLVVMVIPFISIVIHCGLIGHDFEDWVLEWLARMRAWFTLYSLLWVAVAGVALFGHDLVALVIGYSSWIKWPAVGAWLLTTAGAVFAGKSSRTGGEGDIGVPRTVKLLIAVGPPAYILGLLLLLAWSVDEGISIVHIKALLLAPQLWAEYSLMALAVLLPFAVFLLFGWRVDVNQFSMHSYYRNRLERCYLGASNTRRNPDPLTGFDLGDVRGLHLSRFQPRHGYTGPLPLFCATLNISVGEDLAWQERKAASFAFSPVLSGYYVPWTGMHYQGQLSYNGFVPTDRFYAPNGIHISTAAAISGAAVSPNAGYHSSPTMAFLLTMFNVRLGWWMENPRRSYLAFDPGKEPQATGNPWPRPRFAPAQLVQELFGSVGDARDFVYLTDGGHFDNMGLYELVRRRCYYIVICDAEEDTGPVFEGIGMAIRKCRIDFGAEISLDLTNLACEAASHVSKVHWITGTVRYPETASDPAAAGTILYIKSSITGDEAGDLYNYRLQHARFPQDSTVDQWFTESQFESYRRLGQEVVDHCPYLEGAGLHPRWSEVAEREAAAAAPHNGARLETVAASQEP